MMLQCLDGICVWPIAGMSVCQNGISHELLTLHEIGPNQIGCNRDDLVMT